MKNFLFDFISKFIYKYNFKYVRSLVYMLQASEYNLADFFSWFWKVKNFGQVEKRGALKKTMKAKILLYFGYFVLIYVYLLLLALIFSSYYFAYDLTGFDPYKLAFIIIFILAIPYMVFVKLFFIALIFNFAQKPFEKKIIKEAKAKLTLHKGLKIAIAGSYAKTSMKEILKEVLSSGKNVAATVGNQNTPLGIARFVEKLKGDEGVLIFEMGEYYRGDIKSLCEMVHPDIGIVTGVNEAHLSKFKTVENARDTIFEIRDFVLPEKLYINGENVLAKDFAKAENLVYTNLGVGDIVASNIKTSATGTSFDLFSGDKKIEVHSKLLGIHNVGAICVACHIAISLGISLENIKLGIAKTKPFEHRLEPKQVGGVLWLDDSYNGNPDGVRAVINFLKGLELESRGKKFYVTPGLVEAGSKVEVVHKEIGRQLAEAGIDKVVLIKNSATPFIEKGLKENNFRGEVIWFDDTLKALSALPQMTVAGDMVLIQNDWPDQYY